MDKNSETIDVRSDHELNGDLESTIEFLQNIVDSNKDEYKNIEIECVDCVVYIRGVKKPKCEGGCFKC